MGRAPIKNTCPDIDRVIRNIREAQKSCDYGDTWEIEDYKTALDDVMYSLANVESDIEDLRSDNSTLRDWGHEQSDRADKLENELEELKEQIPS